MIIGHQDEIFFNKKLNIDIFFALFYVFLLMMFWRNLEYNYYYLTFLDEDKLLSVVNDMSREDIIEWLSWNDPNGIYNDEQSLKELGNKMTRDEGIEILIRQIEESRVII
jgi:hypothetical protein